MRRNLLLLLLATRCVAASYYVSPTGLDSNNGTSPATAWLTLAHVNAQTFSPGDTIYLQRGGTWNEPLIPPSAGASGNPISFDAYGVGAAPVLSGAAPALTWTYNSGNIWSAPLPAAPASATVLNMQFGSLWGQYKAPVSLSCLTAGVIASLRDFCASSGYVYVYDSSSTNAPVVFYGTTITPIVTVASGYQLINISSKKWLTFQHLRLQNFDQQGVLVWSASDNLVFANMEVDGMVPYGTTPLGIYINATNPTSIKFYNVDAHLNYDGWKIAGTAASTSAISLVNCAAFGNRDAAIVDNVAGGSAVVTYSHFYGNGLSTLWSQDVQGVAGPNVASSTNIGTLVNIQLNFAGGIVPNYVDPQIASYGQYAPWDTFTVDDVGLALPATGNDGILYPNTETYVNSNVLPAFNLYGLKFSGAVVTGYSAAQGYSQAVDTVSVGNWLSQGHGVNSHSWSHQYFTPGTNLNAFTLLYNGTGTASISGNVLSTSVTGGTGSSITGLNLTVAPYNEVKSLVSYLNTLPGYTASKTTVRDVPHTVGLADVAAQPISGTALQFVFDTGRMENDEMTTSMAWLNVNIPRLSETYYVTPDGQESTTTQGYALAAGYTGERGELSMGGALGAGFGSNEVASKGVSVMNIVSFGMAAWNTNTAAQMDAGINCLLFRQKIWGYPAGLFIHMPDLTGLQIFQTLAGLTNHGSTVKLNTQLRDWMLGSWSTVPNTTPSGVYYQLPQPGPVFSAVRTANSPDVGAGQNIGAPYNFDINGVQRTGAWDIGAYQRENVVLGGGSASGYFVMGNSVLGQTCTNPGTAWALQVTSVGWQFCPPGGGAVVPKYNAVSKVDISDLQSAGTSATVEAKYGGGSWTNWAQQQSNRLRNLGFTAAGQYSYQYSSSFPAGGVPFAPTYGVSGYAMQDTAHDGIGPYHLKDLGVIANKSGMKCGASFYQGSEADPSEPTAQAALTDYLSNDFIHGWNFGNAIIAVPEEADYLFGLDQSNNPANAHADMGLMIASDSPVVFVSGAGREYASGSYYYPNSTFYAKEALRDWLLERYLCTGSGTPSGGFCTGAGVGTGSADPSSSSYVGATNASNALAALNSAWGLGSTFTTWNTTDTNGLSGIASNAGTTVSAEAFATGDGATYSFTHTLSVVPVRTNTAQILVGGSEVADDIGNTILAKFGSSSFADGSVTMWQPTTAYALNAVSRNTNNCMILATAGGTSGGTAPSWPTCAVGGAPVTGISDGSVVWTSLGPRPSVQYGTGVALITFTSPPASGAAITVSYTGGHASYASWGGNAACSASASPYACCTGNGTGSCTQGTGLLDENGTHLIKTAQSCGGLTGNVPQENEAWSSPAQIQTDIDTFVAYLAGTYAQKLRTAWLAACGSTCPPMALPAYDGPWNGTASVYAAMAPYVDVFWIAPSWYSTLAAYTGEVQNIINNDGGKPVIVANYFRANPDSYSNAPCDSASGLDCSSTQGGRATFTVNFNQSVLALKNPNGKYAVDGLEHWALYDSHSEGRDFGFFTPNDNPYDGSAASAATSSGSCATSHAYTAPAICQDSNGNLESLTVVSCTSGVAAPTWATGYNALTADGSCEWFNQGSYSRIVETGNWGNALFAIQQFNVAACGPPNYCARTDLAAVTLPAVPPQVGPNTCTAGILNQCGNSTGAGASFTDSNFGSTVYRITDASINQPSNANYTIEVAPTGSGEENLFNCTSPPSMIAIGNSGGWTYPMNFGPPTGQASTRMYAATDSSTNGYISSGTVMGWGRVCPAHAGLLYMLNGTALQSLNLAGNTPSGTPPAPTTVYDFANCPGLPSGFTVTWATPGGGDQSDTDWVVGMSNNGGQGGVGAIYVAAYRVGSGCRLLNLSTDAVTGDWGPTGTISGTPCINTIHNVKIFKSGGVNGTVDITPATNTTCGVAVSNVEWHYGAAGVAGSLTFSCTTYCGGHKVTGLLEWANNPGDNLPNFMDICSITGTCPATQTGLTAALPVGISGLDMHYGWNSLNDSWPFCGSTYNAGVTTAWSNEILCFSTSYGPNPWRFASTENTALNADFCTYIACGAVSQDGKWFMWTSDWQGTLGSTTGSATCTLGSSGNCRGDVFAVALR